MQLDLPSILALPKAQQLAIVQAILTQWQAEEATSGNDDLLQRQLDAADSVANAIDSNQMGTISLSEFQERIKQYRS